MKIAKSLIIAALLGNLTADALLLNKHHKKHHHHHILPAEYVMEAPPASALPEKDAETKAAEAVAATADKSDAVPADAISLENLKAKQAAGAIKEQMVAEEAKAVPIGNLLEKLEQKDKLKELESFVNAPAPTLSEDEQKEEDRKEVNKLVAQAEVNTHAKAAKKLALKVAKSDGSDETLKADLAKAQAVVAADEKKASEEAAVERADPKPSPAIESAKAEIAKIKSSIAADEEMRATIMRASDQNNGNGPEGQKPVSAVDNKEAEEDKAVANKIRADIAREEAEENEKDEQKAKEDAAKPKRNDGAEDAMRNFDDAQDAEREAEAAREAAAAAQVTAQKQAVAAARAKDRSNKNFQECFKDDECWTANMPHHLTLAQQQALNMVVDSDSDSSDDE